MSLEEIEAKKEVREEYTGTQGGNFLEVEIKEVWLKEGDCNTRFFHKTGNAHKRRNWLAKVKVNSRRCTKENEIKVSVVGYFRTS